MQYIFYHPPIKEASYRKPISYWQALFVAPHTTRITPFYLLKLEIRKKKPKNNMILGALFVTFLSVLATICDDLPNDDEHQRFPGATSHASATSRRHRHRKGNPLPFSLPPAI